MSNATEMCYLIMMIAILKMIVMQSHWQSVVLNDMILTIGAAYVCMHKLRVNDFSINILVCAKSNIKIKQLNQFKQSIKIVITSFWHAKEQLVNELICKYTWKWAFEFNMVFESLMKVKLI